jgi:hypothetical protein
MEKDHRIDQTQARPDRAAVDAALAVLDRLMAALNSGDEPALLVTPHFPHYRLAGGSMLGWNQPAANFSDFLPPALTDWHHSEWDLRGYCRRTGQGAFGRAVHALSHR